MKASESPSSRTVTPGKALRQQKWQKKEFLNARKIATNESVGKGRIVRSPEQTLNIGFLVVSFLQWTRATIARVARASATGRRPSASASSWSTANSSGAAYARTASPRAPSDPALRTFVPIATENPRLPKRLCVRGEPSEENSDKSIQLTNCCKHFVFTIAFSRMWPPTPPLFCRWRSAQMCPSCFPVTVSYFL